MEAVNDLLMEDNLNLGENVRFEDPIDLEDIPFHNETDNSEAASTRHEAGTARAPKKRKLADNIDTNLCDLLGRMQNDTNNRLESIAHRIGYQCDLGQARKEVWALLNHIDELNKDDKFDAADVLIENPQKLEFFSSFPAADRPTYVRRLLNGKGV